MNISKELLSLVLGIEVESIIGNAQNLIAYWEVNGNGRVKIGLSLDTLGRLIREKLRSMNYITTMYIHVDTVAINLSQDGKKIYSTPPMVVRNELECSIEALDYVVNL